MPAPRTVSVTVYRIAGGVAGDSVAVAARTVRVADHHPRGTVETVLQVIADHSEIRQPHPASLHRARTRHTVALAFLPHLRGHVL